MILAAFLIGWLTTLFVVALGMAAKRRAEPAKPLTPEQLQFLDERKN